MAPFRFGGGEPVDGGSRSQSGQNFRSLSRWLCGERVANGNAKQEQRRAHRFPKVQIGEPHRYVSTNRAYPLTCETKTIHFFAPSWYQQTSRKALAGSLASNHRGQTRPVRLLPKSSLFRTRLFFRGRLVRQADAPIQFPPATLLHAGGYRVALCGPAACRDSTQRDSAVSARAAAAILLDTLKLNSLAGLSTPLWCDLEDTPYRINTALEDTTSVRTLTSPASRQTQAVSALAAPACAGQTTPRAPPVPLSLGPVRE